MRVQRQFLRRLMVASLLAIIAPALSAQAQNRASEPAPSKPAPAIEATPAVPSAKEESKTQPSEKDAKPADKAIPTAQPHIALILPLASKTFGKVADAVKQGFLAGATADGKNAPPYRVYSAEDEGGALIAQYRKAAGDGAVTVIGGVTRDGASIMAREASYLPTLALNAPVSTTPAGDADLPERFFHISLNLDWEARLAARAAANDGFRRVAVINAASPLAKRIQDSFEKEWIRLGGEIAVRIAFGNELGEGSRVSAAMEKANADAVFIAAEVRVARFARPYLPSGMPVFATSLTIDPRANAIENLDLESVRFMEMPWFVQPDHPAVMAYSRPTEVMPIDFERLYALGIDAWRVAQVMLANQKAKAIPPLDGVTGRITLDGHQFVRQLAAGEIRDGRPTLFKPAE
jgi:hypothetical protein